MSGGPGESEVPLAGGNATSGVVRVGDTVRKPWLPSTPDTAELLRVLRRRGLDVPQIHGRDEHGRAVIDFVPGTIAMDEAPLAPQVVRRVGERVRALHDACEGLPLDGEWRSLMPAEDPDLLCHNDLATWNLVIDGDRLVFIDWDGVAPSTRLWDLAYAAISFAHLFPGADVGECATRLTAFVAGYDADETLRAALPVAMARRAGAMHDLLRDAHAAGVEPWGSMFVEGHGTHWAGTTTFVTDHAEQWRAALAH